MNKFIKLFETLKILHSKKIYLKDIKPANIMTDIVLKYRKINLNNLQDFDLYFVDFGLVGATVKNHVASGTPFYLHPFTYILKIN